MEFGLALTARSGPGRSRILSQPRHSSGVNLFTTWSYVADQRYVLSLMLFRHTRPRLAASTSRERAVDDDTHSTSYCQRTRAYSVGRDAAALWRARGNLRSRKSLLSRGFRRTARSRLLEDWRT